MSESGIRIPLVMHGERFIREAHQVCTSKISINRELRLDVGLLEDADLVVVVLAGR